jgi:Ca-activated chloride channel family protein
VNVKRAKATAWTMLVAWAPLALGGPLAGCTQSQHAPTKSDEAPAKAAASEARDRGAPRPSAYAGAAEAANDGAAKAGARAPSPVAMRAAGPGLGAGLDGEGAGGRAAEAPAAIDPNGRFATTYRPGGGHLAAFDSAVARGQLPQTDRELVAEVGARYAATMAAPTKTALALGTDFERSQLPPSGGTTHLRLSLRSSAAQAKERPHLSVHLVLDVSGSMRGESIERAREAAAALVDKLGANDDFSLVTFSSDAQVVVADGPVGARRAQIKKTISEIKEGGGTNISAGLELGYAQARTKTIPADAVRVVMLLSDGRANAGITQQAALSKLALDAFQEGVQTSSFGLGSDYDGPLMSAIAGDGAGGYYYLKDGSQIASALTTELEERVDPVATGVELRVRLADGVQLLRVYGSRRLGDEEASRVRAQEVAIDKQAQQRDGIRKDRQDDAEGGMRFFVPAFARDDAHSVLLEVRVPAGVEPRKVAIVELKYKDRVAKKNWADELTLRVPYAKSDAASAATANASVQKTVQGFAAGEAIAKAARLAASGNRVSAAQVLEERKGILEQAATSLSEPAFLDEARRLGRLRAQVEGSSSLADPLLLAMVLQTASHARLR